MNHEADTPRWTVTQFDSALLEHDGETCNEIDCASRDEAECLVDLLNNLTKRAEEAEAEVERLRTALQSCYWATNTYDGNYTRACDNVATIAINALKTQDK
jgi:tRNA C32,U32 (ribose-2'-O)-methylase TrmJ